MSKCCCPAETHGQLELTFTGARLMWGCQLQMEELAALVNILLVAPDSLIGLVQTSLHMPHRQALTYIRLREDFAVARVDGVLLSKIFAHE